MNFMNIHRKCSYKFNWQEWTYICILEQCVSHTGYNSAFYKGAGCSVSKPAHFCILLVTVLHKYWTIISNFPLQGGHSDMQNQNIYWTLSVKICKINSDWPSVLCIFDFKTMITVIILNRWLTLRSH